MRHLAVLIKPASGMCNLNCRYCFYRDEQDLREIKNKGFLSDETARILIGRALLESTHEVTFAFQGGEPTLIGLAFFERFCATVDELNRENRTVHYCIQTNGILIDEKWCKFFHDRKFLVGLSLDGSAEIHDFFRVRGEMGTFREVTRAAQLFKRFSVDFNILCVVTDQLARHPQRVYRSLTKSGYQFLQFIPCLNGFDDESEEYSLKAETYGKFLIETFRLWAADFKAGKHVSIRDFDNWIRVLCGYPPEMCSANGFCSCQFVVEGNGDVYPCDFYCLDEWQIGNVRENSFREMFESDVAQAFMKSGVCRNETCRICPYFAICRGGCRRNRSRGENQFCSAYRAFFDACLPEMKEIANYLMHR